MRAVILGVALSVLGLVMGLHALQQGPAAEASFHDIRIEGIMAGAEGNDSVQYVELQMVSGGQQFVNGKDICFFDAGGAPWARFRFPSNAAFNGPGVSILVGSSALDAAWPNAPDFTFSAANTVAINQLADVNAPVPYPGGKVSYGTGSGTPCQFMSHIDSVVYGTGNTAFVDYPPQFPDDLPINGKFALNLEGALCTNCSRTNAADYDIVGNPSPKNGAGNTAPLGDVPTVTPGPTATPGPTPTPAPTVTPAPTETPQATVTPTPGTSVIQGDADCDDDADEFDALAIIKMIVGLGFVPCMHLSDVNCDDGVDSTDMLLIVEYVVDLFELIGGCIPIGDEVVG